MPIGSELFSASLKRLGAGPIFTLVGDHLNDPLQVLERDGFPIYDTRHEAAAVHMADGWARMTRQPGVSLVTGAPGHTNSITGIATAHYTGAPLVSISGMSTSKVRDRGGFQDMDQAALVQGIVKYCAVPNSAAQIPFHLRKAFMEALCDRPGATHLSIPVDHFTAEAGGPAPLPDGPYQVVRPRAESAQIDRVIDLLDQAERPVVIAGGGAWWSDCGRELEAFIEKTQTPLFTITLSRGLVSDEHPLCFGYADPTLNAAADAVFKQADLVIVLGKRLDYRLRLGGPAAFSPDAKFVQVDVHQPELGLNRRLDAALAADVKLTLDDLNEALEDRPMPDRSAWLAAVAKERDDYAARVWAIADKPLEPMHSLHFYREMRKWVPEDSTLCWDGGDFVHWGRYAIPARQPGHWMRLGGLAGLGVAFPIGHAAQILRPNSRSIVVTGDGSLGFYLAEMDTAVRFNLPVIIIVGNDGGWGIERELQEGRYDNKTVACELRRTRYDLVMKGFGGDGEHVETPDQIRPALDRALRSDKPYLINVEITGTGSPFTYYQLNKKI
ncbi:MAG: thiamine pyrophosphate-binding protein [Acidobacteria bacterium]|nr:thiamine pyrophosphate-binding protein [Acidobacteriota bacterium]